MEIIADRISAFATRKTVRPANPCPGPSILTGETALCEFLNYSTHFDKYRVKHTKVSSGFLISGAYQAFGFAKLPDKNQHIHSSPDFRSGVGLFSTIIFQLIRLPIHKTPNFIWNNSFSYYFAYRLFTARRLNPGMTSGWDICPFRINNYNKSTGKS